MSTRRNSRVRLFVLFVCSLFGNVSPGTAKDEPSRNVRPIITPVHARSRLAHFIDWFPPRTETLIVFHEDWLIPKEPPTPHQQASSIQTGMRDRNLAVILKDRRVFWNILSGQRATLWIQGTYRFRLPGLNSVQAVANDGCQLFVFDQPISDKHKKLCRALRVFGGIRHKVEGVDVLEYVPKAFQRDPQGYSFWICLPQPNVLLIATDPVYLRSMLLRAGSKGRPKDVVFPESFREWKHINVNSTVYGIRRYRPDFGETDISDARHHLWKNEGASSSGFTFRIDETKNQAEITWFDCDDAMVRKLKKSLVNRLSDDPDICHVDHDGTGTLTIRVKWPNKDNVAERIMRIRIRAALGLWLQWYLGHAAVV